MHGADRFGNSNTMLVLSVTALYELAAPSTPPEAQTEVERRVAAGELVSGTNAFVAEGFSSVPLNAKSRPCGLRHVAMTRPPFDSAAPRWPSHTSNTAIAAACPGMR
jgi:hypothetical protein